MSDRAAQLQDNKVEGSQFELLFQKTAKLQGFGVHKNKLSCDIIGPGAYRPVKSELDWLLIDPKDRGRVSYVDTKCFLDDHFVYSVIKQHQIDRAVWFNDFGVTAGFAVWFKSVNRVVFFSGKLIRFFGERNRFSHDQGVLLGAIHNFDIRRIYEAK